MIAKTYECEKQWFDSLSADEKEEAYKDYIRACGRSDIGCFWDFVNGVKTTWKKTKKSGLEQ